MAVAKRYDRFYNDRPCDAFAVSMLSVMLSNDGMRCQPRKGREADFSDAPYLNSKLQNCDYFDKN